MTKVFVEQPLASPGSANDTGQYFVHKTSHYLETEGSISYTRHSATRVTQGDSQTGHPAWASGSGVHVATSGGVWQGCAETSGGV